MVEYRSLGRSGMKVAPLVVGTMNFGDATSEEDSYEILRLAHEAGVNMIDTAGNYTQGVSEEIIGRAIKRLGKRHEFVLATKGYFPVGPGPNDRGNSRLHLMRTCDESLRRLAPTTSTSSSSIGPISASRSTRRWARSPICSAQARSGISTGHRRILPGAS